MTRYGVTIPSRTAQYARLADYALMAEEAGFESAWLYHLWRDPLCALMSIASRTEQITLATGVVGAFGRSPMEMACAAHDVDERSGSRMILGLGAGVPELLHAFHSVTPTHTVGRMSEYIDVVRVAWRYLMEGTAEPYAGTYYAFQPPAFNYYGSKEHGRSRIPIFVAALGPQMLRLVGRKADGWIGYLATPQFMTERVLPGIAAGAKAAGRPADEIETAAEIVTSIASDRDVALRRARIQVGTYLAHPASDEIVRLHGLEGKQAELRQLLMTQGPAALEQTDEALVEAFSICGTPEEARQRLDEHRGLDRLIFHTPYVSPLTAAEAEDAYLNLIATFGGISSEVPASHQAAAS